MVKRTEVMTIGEEDVAFYYQLGNAVTQWADVENVLRAILLACFENRDEQDVTHRALSVGYFSIDGFRAKMDFVEGVVNRRFAQHQSDWARLVQRTRRSAGERNKLAHWSVVQYPANNPGRRFMLVPAVFKKTGRRAKRPQPPEGAQGLRDIVKMRMEFIALAMALHNFCARVQGQPEPHPRDHEQPGRPPLIGTLRGQILVRLARLLRSSEGKP